jgi:hypothetical protein
VLIAPGDRAGVLGVELVLLVFLQPVRTIERFFGRSRAALS